MSTRKAYRNDHDRQCDLLFNPTPLDKSGPQFPSEDAGRASRSWRRVDGAWQIFGIGFAAGLAYSWIAGGVLRLIGG